MTMIAETISGPSITARQIPLNKSLKNNHIVCCKIDDNNVSNQQKMG
jgi:hypothetical protein